MDAKVAPQDGDGGGVERHGDRLAGLGLVGMDPGAAPGEVHLFPAQADDVALAQAGGEGEGEEIPLMCRQLGGEVGGLLWGQVAHAALRLGQQADGRRAIEPVPFALGAAKNGADQREVAVGGGRRGRVGLLPGDAVDALAGDVVQMDAGQMSVEPAQLGAVAAGVGFVRGFGQPADNCFLPCACRSITEAGLAPEVGFEAVVPLLRLGAVRGASRAAYWRSTRDGELGPPGAPAAVE